MATRLLIALAPIPLVLLLGAGFEVQRSAPDLVAVNVDSLPARARELLPGLEDVRLSACPEIPLVWLVAQIQTESSWDPNAYSAGGAAGLLQLMPATWESAGGGPGWSVTERPSPDHDVWEPEQHFLVALPWMCRNLESVTQHIRATDKPVQPLVAMAVCHVAGCSRVANSATGIPSAGEARCDESCAAQVAEYLSTIEGWLQVFALPVATGTTLGSVAQPYQGGSTGCSVSDPTGTGGCVTAATAWLVAEVSRALPPASVSCWSAHSWNPTSDHPKGRACDYTFGRIGEFPSEVEKAAGWQLADWLRANAVRLSVSYVIWQGRIWSVGRATDGWRVYSGGGVYDPNEPTGGHYDHVHVSVAL